MAAPHVFQLSLAAVVLPSHERSLEEGAIEIKFPEICRLQIASTWEGIRACEILQKQDIDTNMTLLFSFAQVCFQGLLRPEKAFPFHLKVQPHGHYWNMLQTPA